MMTLEAIKEAMDKNEITNPHVVFRLVLENFELFLKDILATAGTNASPEINSQLSLIQKLK